MFLTREPDVWSHGPPRRQGLYGTEKLNSELLVQTMDQKIIVKIARFHNVYGPEGGNGKTAERRLLLVCCAMLSQRV